MSTTDQPAQPDQPDEQQAQEAPAAPPAPTAGSVVPAPGAHVAPTPGAPAYGAPVAGPIGQVRSTGTCILLTIVTLGFYSWYWYYQTHDEMKRHTGEGIGGGVALLLAILVGFVMPFLNSHEVGRLYERQGRPRPVSATTGLWYLLLGWFFLVGAIVWFVKTNGALNDYWKSQGAVG